MTHGRVLELKGEEKMTQGQLNKGADGGEMADEAGDKAQKICHLNFSRTRLGVS